MTIQDDQTQAFIKCYLLGVLDEPKQHDFEQRLLTDEVFFEELQIAEDDLIDDYLANRLSPSERSQFETHFLASPARQNDLSFSLAFKRYVADAAVAPLEEGTTQSESVPSSAIAEDGSQAAAQQSHFFSALWKRPALFYTGLSVSVCILGIIAWVVFTRLPNQRPQGRAQIEQELAQLNEPNSLRQLPTGGPTQTYRTALTSGLTRGSGATKTLQISPQVTLIEIGLEIPATDYSTYQVTTTSEGSELFSVKDLRASSDNGNSLVRLYLLPKHLPHGDYQVKLSGATPDGKVETVSSYSFRVVIQ